MDHPAIDLGDVALAGLRILPEPLVLSNLSGSILFANAQAREFLKHQPEPERGRVTSLLGTNWESCRGLLRASARSPGRYTRLVRDPFDAERECECEAWQIARDESAGPIVLLRIVEPTTASAFSALTARLEQQAQDLSELRRTRDRLEKMAATDGLTGIANRRSFDLALDRALRAAARRKDATSLLLIDIDHFKRFNDTYGHSQGDECLRQVAQAIDGCVGRPYDMVARYGGEEFAIILPGTSELHAKVVADAVLSAVRDLQIPHSGSETGIVTISVGVSTSFSGSAVRPNTLIEAADRALYQAKHRGRDRFVVAPMVVGPSAKIRVVK